MKARSVNAAVCILDYGSGNVGSVYNLVSSVADVVSVSNDARTIREATHLVLPGVGAFGAAISKIKNRIPLDIVEDEVRRKAKPFLGICVGMQVLAERGYEFGEHEGLGWISGVVDKLDSRGLPLPHVGWNGIQILRPSTLLESFGDNQDFYFVHSFVFRAANDEDVVAIANYGEDFCSILKRQNIVGVQFHPEKSQKAGYVLMRNFLGSI